MSTPNGGSEQPRARLELSDTLKVETTDGASRSFEVVGILEDPDDGASYAVLRHEGEDEEDEFIVTDLQGNLLQEEQLAQEILDDFLAFAEEDEERGAHNGERR
jgi:hypothetical protein